MDRRKLKGHSQTVPESTKYLSDIKCPKCGLLFQNGCWKWNKVDPRHEPHWRLCPACLQIRDRYTSGALRLSGAFVAWHREEVLRRIRKLESELLGKHPLERIVRIEETKRELVIFATAEHLVNRIGKILRRDFGGRLEFRRDMRVRRDDSCRPTKYHSDTTCPKCGLLFQNGGWKWNEVEPRHKLHWKLCPPCLQIRDRYASGVLRLSGAFGAWHREEVLRRIRKLESEILEKHPLERIVRIEESKGELVIFATAEHLVTRIGKTLRRDFGGKLDIEFRPRQKFAFAE